MNARILVLLGLPRSPSPGPRTRRRRSNPFLGSAPPPGPPSPQPIALSVKDAVTRALQYNLGLLLQEANVDRRPRRPLARARGSAAQRLGHGQRAAAR